MKLLSHSSEIPLCSLLKSLSTSFFVFFSKIFIFKISFEIFTHILTSQNFLSISAESAYALLTNFCQILFSYFQKFFFNSLLDNLSTINLPNKKSHQLLDFTLSISAESVYAPLTKFCQILFYKNFKFSFFLINTQKYSYISIYSKKENNLTNIAFTHFVSAKCFMHY